MRLLLFLLTSPLSSVLREVVRLVWKFREISLSVDISNCLWIVRHLYLRVIILPMKFRSVMCFFVFVTPPLVPVDLTFGVAGWIPSCVEAKLYHTERAPGHYVKGGLNMLELSTHRRSGLVQKVTSSPPKTSEEYRSCFSSL